MEWVSVDASADGREGDGFEFFLGGQGQRIHIATSQEFGVFGLVVIDGAYGVNDVFGGEVVGFGNLCLASGASVEGSALGEELWSGCAVNGAVYASAA